MPCLLHVFTSLTIFILCIPSFRSYLHTFKLLYTIEGEARGEGRGGRGEGGRGGGARGEGGRGEGGRARGKGEGLPSPFLKIDKKCPDLSKKCPDFGKVMPCLCASMA